MSTAQELVAKGAAWLDSTPEAEGWPRRIDVETVNVTSSHTCVLAQVFKDVSPTECCSFHDGAKLLADTADGSVDAYGFNRTAEVLPEELRAEWVRVIGERIAATAVEES